MRVLSLNEAADLGNMSRRNLEKMIADGTGPAIIKLSVRRFGILDEDWRVWLLARRRMSPGQVDAERANRAGRPESTTAEARVAA